MRTRPSGNGGLAAHGAVVAVAFCILVQLGTGSFPLTPAAGGVTPEEKNNWPSFRGPGANGHAINANPPLTWNVEDGRNIQWKTVVPKSGLNSPVVWDNRLFLTGADLSSREIYCFATDNGKLLWQHAANDIPGSPWAGGFLDYWTARVMRSRLEPMKRVARMLRRHDELLLNWFRAKGEVSSGVVEGLNNKIRVVTRRSYGFRTYKAMEIALFHNLGRLPEPENTHRFC